MLDIISQFFCSIATWLMHPSTSSIVNNTSMAIFHMGVMLVVATIVEKRSDFEFTGKVWAFLLINTLCLLIRLFIIQDAFWGPSDYMRAVRPVSSFLLLISLIILSFSIKTFIKLPSSKELEESNSQLEASNLQLQEKVSQLDETLAALTNEKREKREAQDTLLQAQKMEAVGQLTGGIAHDFNNLLQAIGGSFELIKNNPNSKKLDRWVGTGIDAVARAAHLTARLLTFSRVQRLQLREVELKPLMINLKEMLKPTLGPDIKFTMSPIDDVLVNVDPTQLDLAIINLSLNARDAMPEGGSLHLATSIDNDRIEIDVTDTGTGIDPDVVTRIFEPFFTTKDVGKGTGLGLSMVYGVAQHFGGEVYIKKTSPQGTTFTISIPFTERQSSLISPAKNTDIQPSSKSKRIVLIDDDIDVRETLGEILLEMGHEVTPFEDGISALGYLKAHEPDLILVDFAMPLMNGAEVVKASRTIYPGIPIAFVTGFSTSSEIEGQIVLKKPFQMNDIEQLINRFFPIK